MRTRLTNLNPADAERVQLTRLVIDHVAGRVPVIVTTSHFSSRVAAARSRQAQEAGAALVMLMAPYHGATIRATERGTREFFPDLDAGARGTMPSSTIAPAPSHRAARSRCCGRSPARAPSAVPRAQPGACPFCGSTRTAIDNLFGPTPCRSLYHCLDCRNPFERFKAVNP